MSSTSSKQASRTAAASRRSDLVAFHLETNTLTKTLSRIRTDLEDLENSVGSGRRVRIGSDAIDLVTDVEYTTLASTEEMNTSPTSFETHEPEWTGASTSAISISGEYSGQWGDDELEFIVKRDRTVGGNKWIRVDVRTVSDNEKRDTLWFRPYTDPASDTIRKSGLTVTLTGGDVKKNDTAYLEVFDTVGTDVDPDMAFDEADAWLESPITDGTFEVDGVSIDVFSTDTLNDVIARMEANLTHLDIGLSGDQLTLTRTTADDTDIVLGSDDSGFFDAMKLTGAVADLGYAGTGTGETPIDTVEDLASVADGTLTVNGVDISIDVSTDSLIDVVQAINSGVDGVVASLDPDAGTIELRTSGNVRNLTLEDDTGLLAAFGIDEGLYRGGTGRALSGSGRRDAADLMLEMEMVLSTWNQAGGDSVGSMKTALSDGIELHTEDSTWEDIGLSFDFDEDAPMDLDRTQLDRMLRTDPDAFFEQLLGEGKQNGLLDTMLAVLDVVGETLAKEHGSTGLLLDVAA